jgi:hypothetical protein
MRQRKRKRYTLVYPDPAFDSGIYNIVVYRQHPFDILAARCTGEIEQAKQRVEITSDKKYKYEPSTEYKKFYKKHIKKRRATTNNNSRGRDTGNNSSINKNQ